MTDERRPEITADAPPASSLTARELARRIFPRRKRLGWGLGIGVCWALAGTWWGLILTDVISDPISFDSVLVSAVVAVGLLPAALFILPAVSGAQALASDQASGRFASLGLTLVDDQVQLAAYHRRALATGLLFLAALASFWTIFGRAPYPLVFVPGGLDCQLDDPGLLVVPRFLAGAVSDASTVYLAAALGLGALVWTRSKSWAMVVGPLAGLIFGVIGWLAGWAMAAAMNAVELRYYSAGFIFGSPVEPGYTLLLWAFAAVYSGAAFVTARAVLRAAARRLDRLIAD